MVVQSKGAIIVLDDGGPEGADLVTRVHGVWPQIYRLTDHDEPNAEDHVLDELGRRQIALAEIEAQYPVGVGLRFGVQAHGHFRQLANPRVRNGLRRRRDLYRH